MATITDCMSKLSGTINSMYLYVANILSFFQGSVVSFMSSVTSKAAADTNSISHNDSTEEKTDEEQHSTQHPQQPQHHNKAESNQSDSDTEIDSLELAIDPIPDPEPPASGEKKRPSSWMTASLKGKLDEEYNRKNEKIMRSEKKQRTNFC